ncbi:MAG: RNase A-like domain-containing protein [Janthinobacterium lividum]
MRFTQRHAPRVLPPIARASRWSDIDTANHWTTEILRLNETRLRRSVSLAELWVELRGPVPASAGVLYELVDGEPQQRPVTSGMVRMDFSASAPRVLESLPQALPAGTHQWDLLQILARQAEDVVAGWLDPRAAIDEALAADPDRAARALVQWQEAIGIDPTPTQVAAFIRSIVGAPVPPWEGVSWSAWSSWFVHYLSAVADGREVLAAVVDPPIITRTGEFDDGVDLGEIVDSALEARSDDIQRWLTDPDSPRRLHVVTDVGTSVGTVLVRQPELAVAASAVAVVLERTSDDYAVLDAFPEIPLDADLRTLRPVASSVLAAYFGPGTARIDVQPWFAQRNLLSAEHGLQQFTVEIEGLLAGDDRTLSSFLLGCGCAVLPRDPRGWLRRMLWRSRSFPWTVTP